MEETDKYLADLKSDQDAVRQRATQALWSLWYKESGEAAEDQLKQGMRLMDTERLEEASQIFLRLVKDYPDFPEAHNKLATVLYLAGDYREAVEECRRTLRLNPHHFGAWNGLGLCLFHQGQFDSAITAFEKALEIQPHADANRQYIGICRAKLN